MVAPTAMDVHAPDYESLFDRTLSVLRRHDFSPDRVERPRGVIVSEPSTSAQWFEWWRGDARGGYQLLESCLHTMQRVVTVNFEPLDDEARAAMAPAAEAEAAVERPPAGGTYRVTVKVDKLRRLLPARQITTGSAALHIYNERVPTFEGLRGPASREVRWVPLGRDGLLESYLLQRLAEAPDLVLATNAAAPPAQGVQPLVPPPPAPAPDEAGAVRE
ncbi:MAG: hypothetical protein AB1716_07075 [Planctomycetota bacterium]